MERTNNQIKPTVSSTIRVTPAPSGSEPTSGDTAGNTTQIRIPIGTAARAQMPRILASEYCSPSQRMHLLVPSFPFFSSEIHLDRDFCHAQAALTNNMASIQKFSPITTNGKCQKPHSAPRVRLARRCRVPERQPWQGVPPEPGLLPSASEARDQEPQQKQQ